MSSFNIRRAISGLAAMLTAVATIVAFSPAAHADAGFQRWVAQFRQTATANGVSGATYDRAFQGITAPDPEVLRKARYQPEFRNTAWQYVDGRVHEKSIAIGRQMARQWKPWLDRIEQRFGVDRHILLAIWSVESQYGAVLENPNIVTNNIRSLATLAYADERRRAFARRNLLAALNILQRGDVSPERLTGSWAGAMGHTQFIPETYEELAVDFDGDGRRDIWNSIPDALASAANLLAQRGWQTGKTWGYEVTIPAGKFPGGSVSLDQWQRLGVTRANGKPFPRGSDNAELKLPDGRESPVFLMLRNFFVIKRYNNSDLYALTVGLLADEIAGYGGLVRDWNRPYTRLNSNETEELQRRLSVLGYYEGPIDGKIGAGSTEAIKRFQQRMNLTQDGYPSKEVLSTLKRN